MKNTPSPNNNFPGNFSSQNKTHRSVFKKVAGIFSSFLVCQTRPSSNPDANRKHGQVIGIPAASAYDSSGSSNKSQLRQRYSDNSGGSSVTTTSTGQVANVSFSIEEIYKATDNFSPANKLGEGGFGTVYKGKLKNGSFVAVKRAKKVMYDNRLFAEFKNEILTLSQIEHLNLVRLFGFLEHGDEKIIVVEYVSNGTLREHLDGRRGNELEIAERLDIAIDVAHAVTYLHMYTDPPIIHRDIKSSNVLVTEKLRGKVADFGFARLASEDPGATHISTQVKGTAGYLDPEYLKTYQLTDKSDVYSFGILLVELMTGRYPLEPKKSIKERVTAKWAMQRLKEGDAVMAMDPKLRRSPASVMVVEKVLKLARHCLAPQRKTRPSMKQCGEVLWGIRKDFREKNLALAASTSHYSENIDVRRDHRNKFGIQDSESYGFRSA